MSDNSVAASQLRSLVERIERIEEEIAACNSDKRDIYAEAKGNGFDVAVLKQVVKIRKQDTNERMEREAILELYLNALGMSGTAQDETEDRAPARAGAPARTRENIEEFDADGVITEPVAAPQHGAGAPSSPAAPATQSPRKAAEAEGESPASSEGSRQSALVSELAGRGNASDNESVTGGESAATSSTSVQDARLITDKAGAPVDAQAEQEAHILRPSPEPAVVMTREQGILRLRPNCQNPGACTSSGGRNHCFTCRKAAEAKAGAA